MIHLTHLFKYPESSLTIYSNVLGEEQRQIEEQMLHLPNFQIYIIIIGTLHPSYIKGNKMNKLICLSSAIIFGSGIMNSVSAQEKFSPNNPINTTVPNASITSSLHISQSRNGELSVDLSEIDLTVWWFKLRANNTDYIQDVRINGGKSICNLGAVNGAMTGSHSIFSVEYKTTNVWTLRIRTQGAAWMTVNCAALK